jgi:hypothetical protein
VKQARRGVLLAVLNCIFSLRQREVAAASMVQDIVFFYFILFYFGSSIRKSEFLDD